MADLSGMFGAIDAAIGQGAAPVAPPADAVDPSYRPLTVRGGQGQSSADATIYAIDAALSPQKADGASIAGSAPILQRGFSQPQVISGTAPVSSAPERPPIALSDVPGDMVQSLGSGIESGAIGLAALPRTMHDAAGSAADWALSKITGEPAAAIAARRAAVDKDTGIQAPGYSDLQSGLEAAAGPMYQPKSVPGDYAHTIGEFLPGAGGNVVTGAVLPALASETAGQATKGTGLEPYARVGAAMAGAPVAELTVGAAKKAAAPVIAGVQLRNAAPNDAAALMANGYAAKTARDAVLKSSSDPAALKTWAAQPPAPETVPGSPSTLAGTIGNDQGLHYAEQQARTVNNAPFNAIDKRQSDAALGTIKNMQPTGDVFAPGQMIRSRLDALDQAAQDAEDRLQSTKDAATQGAANLAQQHAATEQGLLSDAQNAASAIGPRVAPEDAGAQLRGSVESARETARKARSDLYKAVDPDNSLALVSTPVREAANSIVGKVDPYGTQMGSEESGIFAKARTMPDVLPFNSLTEFEKDITAKMSEERRAVGESPTWNRLKDLKGAVQDAIHQAVDNQAAHQSRMVDAGLMKPEATAANRLSALWEENQNAVRDAGGISARTGTDSGDFPGGGTGAGTRSVRTAGQTGRGSQQAPGDTGIPQDHLDAPIFDDTEVTRRPQTPDVPRPLDIHAFVRANGGIVDKGGDLASMGLHNLIAKPGQGKSADGMREAAAEQGYFGGDTAHAMANTDENDLWDALSSDGPRYSANDTNAVLDWQDYDAQREMYNRGNGTTSKPAMPPKAPLSAYSADDAYAAGTAPTAPTAANDGLVPNFDPEAAARLSAAKGAHAEYAQTYRQGPVGGVLKTNGFAGQYQLPNSGVMARAFHAGDRGADDLNAFLKAANHHPEAIAAVRDYALNGIRDKLGSLGTVRPDDLARWQTANAPAIRALEAASPGFMDSVSTAAKATQTLTDAGIANKAARDAANQQAAAAVLAAKDTSRAARGLAKAADNTAAGKFGQGVGNAVSTTEVENAVHSILSSGKDGATRMRSIVQSVQSNPAALDGLRKAGVDAMVRNFTNADGGLSGAKLINFVKNNQDALKELYPHDQVSMFGALARKAEDDARWRTATAAKDGSNTVNKLHATMAGPAGAAAKHLSIGMVALEGLREGYERGGIEGAAMAAAGAGGLYLVNSLRSAGIKRAAQLHSLALSDPEVARLLISKMPDGADAGRLHALARLVRRSAIIGPMAARQGDQKN